MTSPRWFVLDVAAGSPASMTLSRMAHGRRHHARAAAQMRERRLDLHAWENEGGNVTPVASPAVSP